MQFYYTSISNDIIDIDNYFLKKRSYILISSNNIKTYLQINKQNKKTK